MFWRTAINIDIGVLFIIWAIIGNAVWYSAKYLAHSNGLKVSWWWNHLLDIPNMADLWRKSRDTKTRWLAMLHLLALIFLMVSPFFFAAFIDATNT